MTTPSLCPTCQAELPSDSPGGLCPKCLMHLALGRQSEAATYQQTVSHPSPPGGFTPPPVAVLAEKFPHLEILELLGRGGMGAVYKARQPGLDRLVALKILPPDTTDASFAERFTREAKALARLNHPHIVAVYESGRVDGLYYFVMEYVDGVNLREALRTGQIAAPAALGIVTQVCDALQFAHDEGVVHRDIKPENILLDKRGRVKIADFGLAKLLGHDTTDLNLTGTHQVMGTPRYMAPEQLEGTKSVDHRADIYSLGVVFYELLTGELPLGRFAAPSKKTACDERLDHVVFRALEKEPAERYQHASEVKTEVEAISSTTLSRGATELPPRQPVVPQLPSRVTIAHQTLPRTGGDVAMMFVLALPLFAIYWLIPTIVASVCLMCAGLEPDAAVSIGFGGGTAFFFGLAGLLMIMAPQSATLDQDGVTIRRYFGGAQELAWSEIVDITLMTRDAVFTQVWIWPGFPPRGSVLCGARFPFFAFDTTGKTWYFCPADVPRFMHALARFAPPQMPLPELGEQELDQAVARTRAEHVTHISPAAPAWERPARRPWGVTALALLNLILAALFMPVSIMEDSFIEKFATSDVYRAYSYWLTASMYLSSAMLFAGSIGLLLWKSWGRWLTIGVFAFTLVCFVIELPLDMQFTLPGIQDDIKQGLLEEDGFTEEAADAWAQAIMLLIVGGTVTVALIWSIGQLVYFTRPRVAAAFSPPSPAWSAVSVPLAMWVVIFLLVAGGLIAFHLSPLGANVQETVAVRVNPRGAKYGELEIRAPFQRGALRSERDRIWTVELTYRQQPAVKNKPAHDDTRLSIELPGLQGRLSRIGDSNSLVFDNVLAREYTKYFEPNFGENPADDAAKERVAALQRLVSKLAEERPITKGEFEALIARELEPHFEVVRGHTLEGRTTSGFVIEYLVGALTAAGVLFVIGCLVLGSVGQSIVAAGEKPHLRASRELRVLGGALMAVGVITFLGLFTFVPFVVHMVDVERVPLRWLIPFVGMWTILGGIGIFLAGLRTSKSFGLIAPWIGSALAVVPLSPAALLGIPVGIWGMIILSRPTTAQGFAFAQREREAKAAEAKQDRAAHHSRDESFLYQVGSLLGMAARSKSLPAVLGMVAAIIGALTVPFEWLRVSFTAQDNNQSIHRFSYAEGVEHWLGIAAGAIFVAVLLCLFAVGSRQNRLELVGMGRGARAIIMGSGGAVALLFIALFVASASSMIDRRLPVPLNQSDATLTAIVQPALTIAIGCGITLLLAAAWEVRRMLEAK